MRKTFSLAFALTLAAACADARLREEAVRWAEQALDFAQERETAALRADLHRYRAMRKA